MTAYVWAIYVIHVSAWQSLGCHLYNGYDITCTLAMTDHIYTGYDCHMNKCFHSAVNWHEQPQIYNTTYSRADWVHFQYKTLTFETASSSGVAGLLSSIHLEPIHSGSREGHWVWESHIILFFTSF